MKKNYRIGGFPLQLHGEIAAAASRNPWFPRFGEVTPRSAIEWRFHEIDSRSLVPSAVDVDRDPDFSPCIHSGKKSALLGAASLRARVRQCRKHAGEIVLDLRPRSAVVIDHHCRRGDIYGFRDFAKPRHANMVGPGLLTPFLPSASAFMLHASAITVNGRGALFLAPDGGGKTSAVKGFPGRKVLSDDQVLLQFHRGNLRIHGTPWGRMCAGRSSAHLTVCFLLEKAFAFNLSPLTAKEIFAFIWKEHEMYTLMLPSDLKKKAFTLLWGSVPAGPCLSLEVFTRLHGLAVDSPGDRLDIAIFWHRMS